MGEEQRVLTALALLGEVISDQRQKKLKGNQDVGRITEVTVLQINETGEIRELYRTLGEIPETEKEKEVHQRREVEAECEAMGGIFEVNSADQVDQLEARRFKMKPKNSNLPSSKAEKFREMKCRDCERKSQREKLTISTAARPGKLKLGQSENMGPLYKFLSREFRRVGR